MKAYKVLQLFMALCVVMSCSNEPIGTSNEDALAPADFDTSYLGVYKGLFTTEDGLIRGKIELNLSPTAGGLAQLKLSTNEVIELKSSATVLSSDTEVSQLRFSSEDLSSIPVTFEFSVAADGANPSVSNVVYDNRISDVVIAKQTQRAPLTPVTGTYACTNCSVNGQGFPTTGRTWNVMFIGSGNNQNFMTQVSYGGRIYNSAASNNVQDNCATTGDFTTCDINGSSDILGNTVTWNGTHTYVTDANQTACSEVSGTWSTPWGGGAAGTFVSDSDCSGTTVANDLCENALPIAIGSTMTGSTVNATTTGFPSFTCNVDFDTAPGVWYTFVGNGFPVIIDTEGSSFDTKLGLFNGTCGALTCQDGDDNGGVGDSAYIPLNSILDSVYYIYLTGAGTSTGDYVLNLSGPTSFTNVGCNESIEDDGGVNDYSNKRIDVYVIDAGVDNTANLYFSEFDTEEGYDFVKIYDGINANAPLITMTIEGTPATSEGFSGSGVNGTNSPLEESVVSSGRYLTVVFISDAFVVGAGFNADVTCIAGRQAIGMQKTSLTYRPSKLIVPAKHR